MPKPSPARHRSRRDRDDDRTGLDRSEARTRRVRTVLLALTGAGAGLLGLRALPTSAPPEKPAVVTAAEASTRAVVDERVGLHLQRLR